MAEHDLCLPIGAPRLEQRARWAAVVVALAFLAVWATGMPAAPSGAWWLALAGVLVWLAWAVWAERRPTWTGLRLPEAWAQGQVGRAGPAGYTVSAVALGPAWPRGLPLHALRVVWDAGDTLLLRAVAGDGRVLWGWAQRAALPDGSPAVWQRARCLLVIGGAFRSAIFDGPGAPL